MLLYTVVLLKISGAEDTSLSLVAAGAAAQNAAKASKIRPKKVVSFIVLRRQILAKVGKC
jgi:hypothetical protein